MICPRCAAENREGSNFCRICAQPLTPSSDPSSGYIPSVPPPEAASPYPPPWPPQSVQPPPPLPAPAPPHAFHGPVCPRCGSMNVVKGSTPMWAVIVAIIGFFFVCVLSLLFLIVKEPNRCLHCGLEFK